MLKIVKVEFVENEDTPPQSFVFPDYSRAGAKIREDWRAEAKIREDWS